jgi:hypothetical protein
MADSKAKQKTRPKARPTPSPSGEEPAQDTAQGLVDSGALWRGSTTWPVILGEGIVLLVVGLLVWLPTGFGASAVLQILGVAVLLTAAISAWRLIRDAVAPLTVAAVAFRAGVGLTVGLLVVLGSLLAEQIEVTTLSIAVVLGVGFVLYGLSVLMGPLVQRVPGAPFPLGAVALAMGLAVVGTLLIVRANTGIEALIETFSFLGLLLAATGMALVGWSLMLKSHEDAAG